MIDNDPRHPISCCRDATGRSPEGLTEFSVGPITGTEVPMADDIQAPAAATVAPAADEVWSLVVEVRRLARLADFCGAAVAVRELKIRDCDAAAVVAAEVFGDATDWL